MAKKNQHDANSSSKTAVKKRSSESRAFRKLSSDFAKSTKLGMAVEEKQQQQQPKPRYCPVGQALQDEMVAHEKRKQKRARRAAIAKAGASVTSNATTVVAANTGNNRSNNNNNNNSEREEFDRNYANLLEREHARTRTRTRSKKERSKLAHRKEATKKRHEQREQHSSTQRAPPTTKNVVTATAGGLNFQPATFRLERSTAELVNEAAATLQGVQLQQPKQQQMQLGSAVVSMQQQQQQQLYSNSMVEWYERNPNHSPSNVIASSNPFQSLHSEDEGVAAAQQPAVSLFAFQPASFAVSDTAAVATTTAVVVVVSDSMIDPDL